MQPLSQRRRDVSPTSSIGAQRERRRSIKKRLDGAGGGGGGARGSEGGRGGLRAINHGDTRDWSEALSVHNADQTLYIFDITQPERSGGCAPLCQIKKDIQATKAIIQSKRRSA